jgi:hypothetical protein
MCIYTYIWINIRYDNPALSWAYIPWEQTIQLPVPGRLFGWTVRIARAFSEVLSQGSGEGHVIHMIQTFDALRYIKTTVDV